MPQSSTEQAMQIAMRHHRSGQFAAAESIYRKVLAENPNHAEALHLLGAIASDTGRPEAGIDLMRRSIALDPNVADCHSNLGNALTRIGKFDEAIAAYRAALGLKPEYAEVHYNLANALVKTGNLPEGIDEYRQAIRLKPEWAAPHNNLGHTLHLVGQMEQAFISCRRAIQLDPNYADAYFNLGLFLHINRQYEESIRCLREALRLKPDLAEAHYNLGNSLHQLDHLTEAIAAYDNAVRLQPNYPEALNNLGVALRDNGQFDQSNTVYLRSLDLNYENPPVHWNLALNYLLQGKFAEGWEEHEWRWRCEGSNCVPTNFRQPLWNGQDLNGKTILLHAEQGFGDTIQFIRYAPMVARRGGNVIVVCQAELFQLLKSNPQLGRVISQADPLPEFNVHCPLLTLPRAFHTDLNSIPSARSYLQPDTALAQSWAQRIASMGKGLRIGVVWAGRPTHKRDRHRSIPLSQFLPLASIPAVTFFSLQKGAASMQMAGLSDRMKIIDFTPQLNDFAETAALISNLDLVIGADTAVIHLAAALGKPVWLLLSFVPDWRWLLNRVDSPWYPTVRLFRQPSPGEWNAVFSRVADSLKREKSEFRNQNGESNPKSE